MKLFELDKLQFILSRRERAMFLGLALMSVLFALFETASVSLIMPFVTIATDPERALQNHWSQQLYTLLELSSPSDFVVAAGCVLIAFLLARMVYMVCYVYALNSFTWFRYHSIANRLFRHILALSYDTFTGMNSAQIEKTIITEASYLTQLLTFSLKLFAEFITAMLLYAVVLAVNTHVTLVVTALLVVVGGLMSWGIKRIASKQGVLREQYQARFYGTLNDALSNFKYIKLLPSSRQLCDRFSVASRGYCHTNVINTTSTQLPGSLLEAIGFSLLVGVVLYVLIEQGSASILPIASMYALALYRMIPAVNRMLYYHGNIAYYRRSLGIVYDTLRMPVPSEGHERLDFNSSIQLDNVAYAYPGRASVFENVSLTINKNERIGIVGSSGSGKTTLVDILTGIHQPAQGCVRVDGVEVAVNNVSSLRAKVGYIPQQIYLFDGTVAENVVFGRDYDEPRLLRVLTQARILDFLKSHQGIHTQVGEGGSRLSGGQKQRIGIARALYTDPEILVLDEATSALDLKTEETIMEEIWEVGVGRTVIIITHRLASTARCDRIFSVQSGHVEMLSTTEIVGKSAESTV